MYLYTITFDFQHSNRYFSLLQESFFNNIFCVWNTKNLSWHSSEISSRFFSCQLWDGWLHWHRDMCRSRSSTRAPFLMWKWRSISCPGQAGQERKEGLSEKRNPERVNAAGLDGREMRFRFQPDRGSGGRTGILEYVKIQSRWSGHKTAVLALTRWEQSTSWGPALDFHLDSGGFDCMVPQVSGNTHSTHRWLNKPGLGHLFTSHPELLHV